MYIWPTGMNLSTFRWLSISFAMITLPSPSAMTAWTAEKYNWSVEILNRSVRLRTAHQDYEQVTGFEGYNQLWHCRGNRVCGIWRLSGRHSAVRWGRYQFKVFNHLKMARTQDIKRLNIQMQEAGKDKVLDLLNELLTALDDFEMLSCRAFFSILFITNSPEDKACQKWTLSHTKRQCSFTAYNFSPYSQTVTECRQTHKPIVKPPKVFLIKTDPESSLCTLTPGNKLRTNSIFSQRFSAVSEQ